MGELRVVPTPEITQANLRDVDAVIIRSETRVGPDLLDGTNVRFVGTATIGYDHVDLAYLQRRGIGFASAPGSNANSVAEYVATALLVWAGRRTSSLKGMTLGVVGVGNVGRRIVRVGEALGMNVLKNDPPLARTRGPQGFSDLDELMRADILTLHVPLTKTGIDATYHLFDAERLRKMKPGGVLVNTSRGAVVETGALREALQSGRLGAAVLDVWENEPNIDAALLGQVALGTAHIAGYSFDGKMNAARMMFDALCQHFALQTPWPSINALPPAEHPIITLQNDQASCEEALRRVLTTCYAIERDDQDLRALLQRTPEERPQIFRHLRSHYRTRREFAATTVYVPVGRDDVSGALKKLGFTVERRGTAK
jgi:erythronate-4-phosphate dehydrogenase